MQWALCVSITVSVALTVALIAVSVSNGSSEASVHSLQVGAAPASDEQCPTTVSHTLGADLQRMRSTVRNKATTQPPISWTTYNDAPIANSGRHVQLYSDDFAEGTLRLRAGAFFTLEEDVVVDSNAQSDHRPRADQPLYAGPAYQLGFFAAITVEAPNVVIDLQQHTLQQGALFATQQRFYALVELASQPFLPRQGPAAFGDAPVYANGFVLENGTLGRSSHHGVHGNAAKRVLMQQLSIVDYEVAAIALNGCKDVHMRDVHALGSSTEVPVLGTYSNARFIVPVVDRVLASGFISDAKHTTLAAAAALLRVEMAHVVEDVRQFDAISAVLHPAAYALFANKHRVVDGNAYSLLLHPNGAAAGKFWSAEVPEQNSPLAMERVLVERCTFAHTHTHVTEVVALVSAENATVRGPVGDVLRLVDNAGGQVETPSLFDEGSGLYVGTALSDVQIALMDAALDMEEGIDRRQLFGTTHGDANVVRWAHHELTLHQLVAEHGFHYWRNGDTMFHVNRGVLGVRIDGARDVCLHDVSVEHTVNSGARGNTSPLPGEQSAEKAAYFGAHDGGHPDQGTQYGYMGADARGVGIAGSAGVYLRNVHVVDVHAHMGFARGIDVFNHASQVHIGANCSVSGVQTLDDAPAIASGDFANGPRVGCAIGLHASSGSAPGVYGAQSIAIQNVHSGVPSQSNTLVVDGCPEAALAAVAAECNTYEL